MTYRDDDPIRKLVDDMARRMATRHNPNARPMPLSSWEAQDLRDYERRLRSEREMFAGRCCCDTMPLRCPVHFR